MIRRVVQLMAVVVSFTAVAAASPAASADDRQGLQRFTEAIDQYMTLRQRLEPNLPFLVVSDNAQEIHDALETLNEAVVRARAEARPGDIFNLAVGDLFHSRIAQVFAARPHDVARLLSEMTEDGEQWQRAVVNGRFVWRTAAATPAPVLAVLPPLPENLEYRFVGPDLVLVDIEASVILDVVRDVLVLPPGERAP